MPKATSSQWISVKGSKIHNTGVFAKKDIPEGTRILEYVGKKITKKQSDDIYERDLNAHKAENSHGAVYIFEIDKKHDLDGKVDWNTARYINHSCEPNCESDVIKGRVWIIATEDIEKGSELTYDYGYNLEDWQEHPCLCGADSCVGYIVAEEFRPQLLRQLRKHNRRLDQLLHFWPKLGATNQKALVTLAESIIDGTDD